MSDDRPSEPSADPRTHVEGICACRRCHAHGRIVDMLTPMNRGLAPIPNNNPSPFHLDDGSPCVSAGRPERRAEPGADERENVVAASLPRREAPAPVPPQTCPHGYALYQYVPCSCKTCGPLYLGAASSGVSPSAPWQDSPEVREARGRIMQDIEYCGGPVDKSGEKWASLNEFAKAVARASCSLSPMPATKPIIVPTRETLAKIIARQLVNVRDLSDEQFERGWRSDHPYVLITIRLDAFRVADAVMDLFVAASVEAPSPSENLLRCKECHAAVYLYSLGGGQEDYVACANAKCARYDKRIAVADLPSITETRSPSPVCPYVRTSLEGTSYCTLAEGKR